MDAISFWFSNICKRSGLEVLVLDTDQIDVKLIVFFRESLEMRKIHNELVFLASKFEAVVIGEGDGNVVI
jgi:hypothetical protein